MTLRAALARVLLPRYASGTLPPSLAQFVRTGIAADPSLAMTYTQLRRLERTAAGGAATSAGQRDLLENALFAHVEVQTTNGVGARVLPFAGALASVLMFLVVGAGGDRLGTGDLSARGVAMAHDPLGVKISCVSDGRVVGTATVGARHTLDLLVCPSRSLLAFSLTNLSQDARYLFVLGIAADGSRRWYAPFGRAGSAVRVAAGTNNDVLSVLGDTNGMPLDERVSLHALLSDRPFSAIDLERQLTAANSRGVPLGSIDRLPLPDIPLQARVDMVHRP